jgi:hypothetical protein
MCNSLATRLVSREQYIADIEGDTLIVDHLERADKSNKVWQYPQTKDSQDIPVQLEQVLNYVPTGEWDYNKLRAMTFNLTNVNNILKALEKFVK